jgi:hypothetical protein
MSVVELAPRPSVIDGPLSTYWWDAETGCSVTMATPSAEVGLFEQYYEGAVASYTRYGVRSALDESVALCAADTVLFWAITDRRGRVVGGVRAKGPLRCPDDSRAVIEWGDQPGIGQVRKMIADRVPFGVLEMKGAWLDDDPDAKQRPTKIIPRSGFHGMQLVGANFLMATAATHVLERWSSSGGLVAPIPGTPYPDERYRTKMMWWDRSNFTQHGEPNTVAAIVREMAYVHRRIQSWDPLRG